MKQFVLAVLILMACLFAFPVSASAQCPLGGNVVLTPAPTASFEVIRTGLGRRVVALDLDSPNFNFLLGTPVTPASRTLVIDGVRGRREEIIERRGLFGERIVERRFR